MKRASQVLAGREIDADLAPNRAVDLREQGGRHLDEADSTQIGRRGKSSDVPDHAAAEGENCRGAVDALRGERVIDQRDRLQGLRSLTVRHQYGRPAFGEPG